MQESIHRPPVPNANTRRSVRKPLYEAEVDVSKLDIFSLCARFCENHGYTNLPNTSIESQHDLLRDVFLDLDEEDTANQRMYDGLDFSADAVERRKVGDAWAWQRSVTGSIASLEAATFAMHGATHRPAPALAPMIVTLEA